MQHHGCLIIGAGHAGMQLAMSLREKGYQAPIQIIEAQGDAPYQRPPLSKTYLLGKIDASALTFRPDSVLEEKGIRVIHGRVSAIDTTHRSVRLDSGTMIEYDILVFATGADNRRLPIPGSRLPGVFELRTLDDARKLRSALASASDCIIIGGGFIGMEFAAVAAQQGKRVSVVEAGTLPLGHVLGSVTADYMHRKHLENGVRIYSEMTVSDIESDSRQGTLGSVKLSNGEHLKADLVLIGVGVMPNQELATKAGLATDNGILVNQYLETSLPGVYAIGDCARFPCSYAAPSHTRIESVQNAVDQARTLARTLTGDHTAFHHVPWFWSDQYDIKLQIAGLSQGHDRQIVRQKDGKPGFSVYCFKSDKLIAVESINAPADHLLARKLLDHVDRIKPEKVADMTYDLKACLP